MSILKLLEPLSNLQRSPPRHSSVQDMYTDIFLGQVHRVRARCTVVSGPTRWLVPKCWGEEGAEPEGESISGDRDDKTPCSFKWNVPSQGVWAQSAGRHEELRCLGKYFNLNIVRLVFDTDGSVKWWWKSQLLWSQLPFFFLTNFYL